MDSELTERILAALPTLTEIEKRHFLAREAKALGRGGISEISRISGVARGTIRRGLEEISAPGFRWGEPVRCRKKGGGRKPRARGGPPSPIPTFRMTDEEQFRGHLGLELKTAIAVEGLRLEEAAEMVGLTKPQLSRLTEGNLKTISLMKIFNCFTDLGYDLSIKFRKMNDSDRRYEHQKDQKIWFSIDTQKSRR
jgi:predicted XRE-type DNA-binding protein